MRDGRELAPSSPAFPAGGREIERKERCDVRIDTRGDAQGATKHKKGYPLAGWCGCALVCVCVCEWRSVWPDDGPHF